MRVAFLLFDTMDLMDFAGPFEVFLTARGPGSNRARTNGYGGLGWAGWWPMHRVFI